MNKIIDTIQRVVAPFVIASIPALAAAASLQISPVMVELQAGDNASGITLRNAGEAPLYGQVRVFRWDQVNGADTLTPTQDLLASPPLVNVAALAGQLIRLVRANGAPVASEESFRILIDELPPPGEAPHSGVLIRLRYSVPVFVEASRSVGSARLAWSLGHTHEGWTLTVENSGARRAQVAAVELVDGAGKTYVINKGLFGYALAKRARRWDVALPPDVDSHGAMKVRAKVNSVSQEAALTVSPTR